MKKSVSQNISMATVQETIQDLETNEKRSPEKTTIPTRFRRFCVGGMTVESFINLLRRTTHETGETNR